MDELNFEPEYCCVCHINYAIEGFDMCEECEEAMYYYYMMSRNELNEQTRKELPK